MNHDLAGASTPSAAFPSAFSLWCIRHCGFAPGQSLWLTARRRPFFAALVCCSMLFLLVSYCVWSLLLCNFYSSCFHIQLRQLLSSCFHGSFPSPQPVAGGHGGLRSCPRSDGSWAPFWTPSTSCGRRSPASPVPRSTRQASVSCEERPRRQVTRDHSLFIVIILWIVIICFYIYIRIEQHSNNSYYRK